MLRNYTDFVDTNSTIDTNGTCVVDKNGILRSNDPTVICINSSSGSNCTIEIINVNGIFP